MKWVKPRLGDVRVRSGFLWFPITCHNSDHKLETRWGEMAIWEQIYQCGAWLNHYWEDGKPVRRVRHPTSPPPAPRSAPPGDE